jgi:hypothetical protein
MFMSYNIDLSALSLIDYLQMLKDQNLLPGRMILLQDIDNRFSAMEKMGVMNIAQLKKQLSTPQRLLSLSMESGIPEDYLTILKREIGSLEQKPVLLLSFPNIDNAVISELEGRGIKNSKEYFESGLSVSDELFRLCDLVRINGVGAVAAKTFYEAGYRSVSDVAEARPTEMLERVSKVNDEKAYYKAKLGLKDMQFCIDFAAVIIKLGG